jgi:hypothetical protein
MKGLTRAIYLEINYIKERWISVLLFLLASAFIVILFSIVAVTPVGLTKFQGMGYTYYSLLAPAIFPLIILFVTVQMIVLRIVGERAPYGSLDRELIAIPRTSMYFGKLFVHSVISFAQCFIIYIFGFILFPVKSYALSPITIMLLFFLLAIFGLSLGLFVSIFSKHKESAIQITPYIIFGLFITSLMLVLENLLGTSSGFTLNPVGMISISLAQTMIGGLGFEDISFKVLGVIFWIVGLTAVSLVKFNMEKR